MSELKKLPTTPEENKPSSEQPVSNDKPMADSFEEGSEVGDEKMIIPRRGDIEADLVRRGEIPPGEGRELNDSELERSRLLLDKLDKGEEWLPEDEQWFTDLFGQVDIPARQSLLAGVLKIETTDNEIKPEVQEAPQEEVKSEEIKQEEKSETKNVEIAQTPDSSEVKSEEIPPQEKEEGRSVEVSEGSNEVTVPFMITKKMEKDLRLKGYSDEQINKLIHEAAHQILSQTESVKEEEAPKVQTEETGATGSKKEEALEQEKEEKVEIKPEAKKEKKLGILEKLEEFKKNHKILSAFGTAAARMAGNVLGIKILQEGIGVGVGIFKEKKKGGEGWSEATKKSLAKSSTDLGRFLYGTMDVKERRGKLEETVEGFFEAYRDKSQVEEDKRGERFMTKVKELDDAIKGATYLTPVERQAYRDRLAKTIWHYRHEGESSNAKLKLQVKDETEQYIHNKALKYTVARDALNFGLTAVGAGFLRVASFAGFSALQRGTQAYREYQHLQGVSERTDEEVIKSGSKLRKAGYIAKDITLTSAWETANALAFRGSRERLLTREVKDDKGGKKIEYYKGRGKPAKRNVADFASALGTVGTAFGIASLIGSDKIGQGMSDLTEKISNNWSERGGMMFVDGFVDNAKHMWQTYTHPGEAITKMRQAIFGGEEIVTGGKSGVTEGEVIVSGKGTVEHKTEGSSIEKEFVRKEHPEVYKGTSSDSIEEQSESLVEEGTTTELSPEIKAQIDEAVKSGKLDAAAVEAYLASRTVDAAKPPAIEDIQKFSELTRVDKGGSYWSTFMKQFRADPKAFGYEGELTNKGAIDAYGKRILVDYAFREGLVIKNADGTLTDVRIKDPNARVIWQFNKDKGLTRFEYQPGKTDAQLDTYLHKSVKEVKSELVSSKTVEKTVETQSLETKTTEPKTVERPIDTTPDLKKVGTQENSYYTEIDLAEQFRGARSFDHQLHVYAGDLPEVDGEPDGLVDRLRFTDSDDNVLTEVEMPKGRQRSTAELMPEIYRKTQAFDRSLTELQGLMPKSSGTLTLAEQVRVAKLVVPNEALFEDGAVHEADDELAKLDKIFYAHKEYLSDGEFTEYVGKNVDDVEVGTAAKLYDKGVMLKDKLGFKSVDYDLLNEYVLDKKPIEFSSGKNGLEYNHLDDDGRPQRTMLTEQKVVIDAAGTERFDRAAVEKFHGLAEEQLAADRQEYDSLSEIVDDVDTTKKILQLKCNEVTDTEIAEMFSATDRDKAHEVFDYLVARIGKGDEKLLDLMASATVGEALSDIAHKR